MAAHNRLDAQPPWIIAIGASGGKGLDDVTELLGKLHADIAAVIMVVLHRPWYLPSYLHSILTAATALPVIIATDGEQLQTGAIYIGEPSQHITLGRDRRCEVIDDPHRNFGNRTIDLLLRSVAGRAGPRMIGIILSGSLDDGSRGLGAIHDAGGVTMVRSPAKSVWGDMPRNAISFGRHVGLIGDVQTIARDVHTTCDLLNF